MDILEEKKVLSEKIKPILKEFIEKFPDVTIGIKVKTLYGIGYGDIKNIYIGSEIEISIL